MRGIRDKRALRLRRREDVRRTAVARASRHDQRTGHDARMDGKCHMDSDDSVVKERKVLPKPKDTSPLSLSGAVTAYNISGVRRDE